jgi:hypothetical protein
METRTTTRNLTVSVRGFIFPLERVRQIHVRTKIRTVFLRAVGVALLIIGAYDALVYAYQLLNHVTPQAITPLLTSVATTPHAFIPILAFYWTAGAALIINKKW